MGRMTYPLPTTLTQKPPTPWADVRAACAWDVGVVAIMAILGAVAGIVPTLIVWVQLGQIDLPTLAFWAKGCGAVGLALGLWIAGTSMLHTVRSAQGERIAVDPFPFETAAWSTFRLWLASGEHRELAGRGLKRVTFLVPWMVEEGNAVTKYGPMLESDDQVDIGTTIVHRRSAWIAAEEAVPDPKARGRYVRQQRGHVSVRIGPFDVGTAHAVLALERIARQDQNGDAP